MSDALLKNTFNKISPAYELVADVTIATATTQVDFNGLNFGKDDDLLLVSNFVNATGAPVQYKLFVNSNTTPSNYYRQICYADGATVGAGRANNNELANANSNNNSLSETKIKLTNSGYFVTQTDETRNYKTSIVSLMNQYVTSTFTLTGITSLNILSDVANGIGVGSRFQLYRLKAEKVADIIVSSATTQVDITGLGIDKDSEYMLVANRVVGSTLVSNADLALFVNDNVTHTNYYYQQLHTSDTSVSGERINKSRWLRGNLGSHFGITNIKLTNNGYFVSQESQIENLSSNIALNKRYVTSTFTLTSITKLSIIAQETNGIGIGSRFTLYKMK